MKTGLLSLLISIVTVNGFSQTWTRLENAEHSRGQVLNMLGWVTEIKEVHRKSRAATHIKLRGKDDDSQLTLVILKADIHKFEPVINDILNQYVHVKGKIYTKRGKPYLTLTTPNQISIAREMELKTFEPL